MDSYHIWFNLKNPAEAKEFAGWVDDWVGLLKSRGLAEGHRLQRRKLGFGPRELGEFHLAIDTRDMAQLEQAFQAVISADEETLSVHNSVSHRVKDLTFALYRDWPDRK